MKIQVGASMLIHKMNERHMYDGVIGARDSLHSMYSPASKPADVKTFRPDPLR